MATAHRGLRYQRRTPFDECRWDGASWTTLALEWSDAMAYIVGLTATDGCLITGRRVINFKSCDRDLVETYLAVLGRTNQVRLERTVSGGVVYTAQFHDAALYEWFRSAGLSPRKSLTMGSLAVPAGNLLPLARGLLDGDGIRDKGGVKLAFEISTSDEPSRVAAALQIGEGLSAVGMKVDVKTQPFGELVELTARQRSFDVLLVGISVSGDPDPYSFFHSTAASDPGNNFSGYSTLPIDRNLENARRTIDEGARRELYAPVFRTISEEVPVVYLYFSDYLYAQDRSVQGLRIAPLTDPRERFWNVEDWYVRTQPRR